MAHAMILKELVEFASEQAGKIFQLRGELLPMYHAVTTGGRHVLLLPPTDTDKDTAVQAMIFHLQQVDAEMVCFIAEAWMLSTNSERSCKLAAREGLANHPDRREIITIAAETRSGEMQTARRFILRPEHGKARLSPLVMDDMSDSTVSGRMVGLLARREP